MSELRHSVRLKCLLDHVAFDERNMSRNSWQLGFETFPHTVPFFGRSLLIRLVYLEVDVKLVERYLGWSYFNMKKWGTNEEDRQRAGVSITARWRGHLKLDKRIPFDVARLVNAATDVSSKMRVLWHLVSPGPLPYEEMLRHG